MPKQLTANNALGLQEGYTRLTIRDMRVAMHVGVFEYEKTFLQPVLLNLEADVTYPVQAYLTDDYAHVLGYDKLVYMIRDVVALKHYNLLETLAEAILARCFEWPQVGAVRLRLEKPVIFDDCVPGVDIYRVRKPA